MTSEQVFTRSCRSTDKFFSPSGQRGCMDQASDTRSSKTESGIDLLDTVDDARPKLTTFPVGLLHGQIHLSLKFVEKLALPAFQRVRLDEGKLSLFLFYSHFFSRHEKVVNENLSV